VQLKIATAKRDASKTPIRPRFCRGPRLWLCLFRLLPLRPWPTLLQRILPSSSSVPATTCGQSPLSAHGAWPVETLPSAKSVSPAARRFSVTDQGPRPIAAPAVIGPSASPKCSVCGRQSAWIDPFGPLPPRHRPRAPRKPFGQGPKKYAYG
jgi:hypothetical protein